MLALGCKMPGVERRDLDDIILQQYTRVTRIILQILRRFLCEIQNSCDVN